MITGATGLIGSHVAEVTTRAGYDVRALVRPRSAGQDLLRSLGVTLIEGDLTDPESIRRAVMGSTHVVHCAAMVGDWGPSEPYRHINVQSLDALFDAVRQEPAFKRLVMISSLGVYEPKNHYGTDESTPLTHDGFDPYTRTKAESESVVVAAARQGLPAVILRPGFVYGPRDRQVLPRLIEVLKANRFVYFGDGQQLLNNTSVHNIAEAVRLALTADVRNGEVFNITDEPLATRRQFIGAVATALGIPAPTKSLPLWLAKPLAFAMDRSARALGAKNAPLLSMARYKFLALNLQYSIAKAKRDLGYKPVVGFEAGLREAVASLT